MATDRGGGGITIGASRAAGSISSAASSSSFAKSAASSSPSSSDGSSSGSVLSEVSSFRAWAWDGAPLPLPRVGAALDAAFGSDG